MKMNWYLFNKFNDTYLNCEYYSEFVTLRRNIKWIKVVSIGT